MANQLSVANQAVLQNITDFLENAPEFPFDSAVIERLAPLAVAQGLTPDTGTFLQRARDFPISTLLEWILLANQ